EPGVHQREDQHVQHPVLAEHQREDEEGGEEGARTEEPSHGEPPHSDPRTVLPKRPCRRTTSIAIKHDEEHEGRPPVYRLPISRRKNRVSEASFSEENNPASHQTKTSQWRAGTMKHLLALVVLGVAAIVAVATGAQAGTVTNTTASYA